jgi:DNA-binding beta-propeller fold protein YncE
LPLLSQDQLDVSEAVATRDHVATCAWCQGQLRDFDFLRDALRRLDERDTDTDASDTSAYLPLSREEIRVAFIQAPSSELMIKAPASGLSAEGQPLSRQQGRFSTIAAVAAVLLIALLASTIFAKFNTRIRPTKPATTPSLGTVTATVSGLGTAPIIVNGGVSGGAYAMAANDDAVWVHNGDTGMLFRIDPRTNTIVARIHVGHGEGGVSIGQEAVWVANPVEGTVSRIDSQTNTVVTSIPLGKQMSTIVAIAASPSAVWVTDFQSDTLIRIDPQTNAVVARVSSDLIGSNAVQGPIGVSFGAGSVWLCEYYNNTLPLTRIAPQRNQLQAEIALWQTNELQTCDAVVALDQAVWVSSSISDSPDSALLTRIDPASNTVVARVGVRADPYHFAADARGVWVILPHEGLSRIDPQTNRVVGNMALPGAVRVAIGAGAVWVVDGSAGSLLRITPAS